MLAGDDVYNLDRREEQPRRFAAARRFFYKIPGLPRRVFPPAAGVRNARVFHLKLRAQRTRIKKRSTPSPTDETRYCADGIFFSFREEKLTWFATDAAGCAGRP